MYHPMLTYAVLKTRQEDLERELLRRNREFRAARVKRTRVRRSLRSVVTARPRTPVTQLPSSARS